MNKITLFSLAAVVGIASIGCTTTANTNANVKATNLAPNTAVVVNSNSAMGVNTNAMMNTNSSSRYSSNMSRADYEKNEAEYKADQAASTIGTGANDKWLWFKTKAALATTADLRDSTINVDVVNDVITLKGSVATKAQADKAVSVASGIEGKKGVKNELKVQAGDSMTNQATSTTDGDKMNKNANHK
jgi:osmotically-inducible protein OsmY